MNTPKKSNTGEEYAWHPERCQCPPEYLPPDTSGFKIVCTPAYDPQKSILLSIAGTITDYSKNHEGVAEPFVFTTISVTEKIKIPPGAPTADFTVKGEIQLKFLLASPGNVCPYVDLIYGPKDDTAHVSGVILEIPLLKTSGTPQAIMVHPGREQPGKVQPLKKQPVKPEPGKEPPAKAAPAAGTLPGTKAKTVKAPAGKANDDNKKEPPKPDADGKKRKPGKKT
ncbi:MAG: hypothetical protein GY765_00590 [bacterium]|nr:hypothetical protein [bacterium]